MINNNLNDNEKIIKELSKNIKNLDKGLVDNLLRKPKAINEGLYSIASCLDEYRYSHIEKIGNILTRWENIQTVQDQIGSLDKKDAISLKKNYCFKYSYS